MRIDTHTHTLYSDSFSSPEDVVRAALKNGLGGVAITDHNSFGGVRRATEFGKGRDIMVIPGEEVLTDMGEVIGLFLSERIAPGRFEEVVGEMRGQGALVVFPHPCDRLRRGVLKNGVMSIDSADALEAFNARVIFGEDNIKANALADEHAKAVVGGSDAHFLFEVGAGWTEFEGDGEEALREAVRKRKTTAGGRMSAPYVHGFGKVANLVNRFRR